MSQQGQRKAKRGWLRGTFHLDLLRPLLAEHGRPVSDDVDASQVHVDFRAPDEAEQFAEEAKELADQPDMLIKDVAEELSRRHGRKIGRNMITNALRHWYASRGLEMPDGRARRATLKRKSVTPGLYEAHVDCIMQMFDEGILLSAIAEKVGIDRNSLTAFVRRWHEEQGLPVPDGRTRRRILREKALRDVASHAA